MDSFVEEILSKITRSDCFLSIVQNTDGFLGRIDTQEAFVREANVMLLPAQAMELRVHYERWFKGSGQRLCYIVEDLNEVLPDIKAEAFCCTFSICDLLWGYDKSEILRWNASFSVLHSLFLKKQSRYLDAQQTRSAMGFSLSENNQFDLEKTLSELRSVTLDWTNVETIEKISCLLRSAIANRAYDAVEPAIDEINLQFRTFMAGNYQGLLTKSHVKRPYSVNNILKHIHYSNPDLKEIVALVVIDGMSFWQYQQLRIELNAEGMETQDEVTFAWLPSITKLSRQAIFRGDMPKSMYVQNPSSEKKLWFDYWDNRKVPRYMVWYEFEGTVNHPEAYTRLAYVNASFDHCMHGCRDIKDLFDLTSNRIEEIVEQIKSFYETGYRIYITTDHGNVFSHSWRVLSPQEKAMVYGNESRGGRHLIFTKPEYRDYFFNQNPALKDEMLIRDNFAVWQDARCFKSSDEVTHGGSHFLEMIIPFVIIERKQR